ncbi:putative Ig domain-containing protein [Streptomyces sp. NBC_01614]|uniref:putative Ig domain-containing protein n=1 Tax=Streptomyces sp. NBC_01614 TaxID=2975897 RepID=UPI00386A964E
MMLSLRRGRYFRRRLLVRVLAVWAGCAALLLAVSGTATAAPGDLDPTFDADGIVTTQIPGLYSLGAADMFVQGDGKIVTAGPVYDSEMHWALAVARYDADGSLDSSFGGDGIVTSSSSSSSFDAAVAPYGDHGKIVAAWSQTQNGAVESSIAVARYNPDGSLDTTFDSDGIATTTIPSLGASMDMAVQGDKIIVAGDAVVAGGTGRSWMLARYNSNGSLDTSFGNKGGYTLETVPGSTGAEMGGIALQGENIIVAGSFTSSTGNVGTVVGRFDDKGKPDLNFHDGFTFLNDLHETDKAFDVTVDQNRKIVLTGYRGDALQVARVDADGGLDVHFGDGDGIVTTDVSSGPDSAAAVTMQGDRIVIAGYADTGTSTATLVARYLADGSLDSAFGQGGTITTLVTDSPSVGGYARAVAVHAGKIVTAGRHFDKIGETYDSYNLVMRYRGVGTSVDLSTNNPSSKVHELVTFTATLPGPFDEVPTGTVTFYDGETKIGEGTLGSGNTATLRISSLPAGIHTIKAVYNSDALHEGSSDTLIQTVDKYTTGMDLAAGTQPSSVGQEITFGAVVTENAPGREPTGTVTFYDGETEIGEGTLDSFNTTTLKISSLPAGIHTIKAVYNGDASFAGSSGTLSQTVNRIETRIALNVQPDHATVGQPVTLLTTVTVPSGSFGHGKTPTGTVTFYDGATQLGDSLILAADATASMEISNLSVGTHRISAAFEPNSVYAADVSDIVDLTVLEALSVKEQTLPDAVTNSPYPDGIAFSAEGGQSPYTWKITDGALPDGLTLAPDTGTLTGTPTAAGTFTFTVTATDQTDRTAKRDFTQTVLEALSVKEQTLPDAVTNSPYPDGIAFSAEGGQSPYTWKITDGALPDGLTLAPDTGTLTGTPTAAGTFTFTVTATDQTDRTAKRDFTQTVLEALSVKEQTLPDAVTNSPYPDGIAFSAEGGQSPYTWKITDGALPDGLTLAPDTGTLTGTPTAAGTFTFTVTATDQTDRTAKRDFTQTVLEALSVKEQTLPDAVTNSPYPDGIAFSAEGGQSPYTWKITDGALPDGLTLAPDTGTLTGTPTAAGTFTFTVTATDQTDRTAKRDFTQTVAEPLVFTAPAVHAVSGEEFTVKLEESTSGGTGEHTWTLDEPEQNTSAGAAAAAPDWITLTKDGILSGTPPAGTSTGDYPVPMKVTDSAHPAQSTTATVTVTVQAPSIVFVSTNSLPPAQTGTPYKQADGTAVTLTAEGGTTPYTWTITADALPDGLTLTPTGIIEGTPTTVGDPTFAVTATDNGTPALTGSAGLGITVTDPPAKPTITPTTLPTAQAGKTFKQELKATGGTAPYTWKITDGTLPDGLTLAADTGIITGTPTTPGKATFTVTATDSAEQTGTQKYTLTTDPATPTSTPSSDPAPASSAPTTAQVSKVPKGAPNTGSPPPPPTHTPLPLPLLPSALPPAQPGVLSGRGRVKSP